ncbi:MAG: DUF4442 domain-containing protein [Myxococcaceae bacterium]|nr:DUF4442 domain-containing protein [Myxococcaceae bacterium]
MRSIYQLLGERLGYARMLKWVGLYPPYLGAGVRVVDVDHSLRRITVAMKLTAWNQNYLGTQFGGSMYSMVDPFFMLMVTMRLGKPYVAWDKSAHIRFLKPGRKEVRATFELTDDKLEAIRREVDEKGKAEPQFTVDIRDTDGLLVAQVEKWVHVHKASE